MDFRHFYRVLLAGDQLDMNGPLYAGWLLDESFERFTEIEPRVYDLLPILRVMRVLGSEGAMFSEKVELVNWVRCVHWFAKQILTFGPRLAYDRRTAVAMGFHDRLGAHSGLRRMPVELMSDLVDEENVYPARMERNDRIVLKVKRAIGESVLRKGFRAICGRIPAGLYLVVF